MDKKPFDRRASTVKCAKLCGTVLPACRSNGISSMRYCVSNVGNGFFCTMCVLAACTEPAQAVYIEHNWRGTCRDASRAAHRKEYREAIKLYTVGMSLLPQERAQSDVNLDLLLNIAVCRLRMKDYAGARIDLDRIAKQMNERPPVDPVFPARYWRQVANLEDSTGHPLDRLYAQTMAVIVGDKHFGNDSMRTRLGREQLRSLMKSVEREQLLENLIDRNQIKSLPVLVILGESGVAPPLWLLGLRRRFFDKLGRALPSEQVVVLQSLAAKSRAEYATGLIAKHRLSPEIQTVAGLNLVDAYHTLNQWEQAAVAMRTIPGTTVHGAESEALVETRLYFAAKWFRLGLNRFIGNNDLAPPTEQLLQEALNVVPRLPVPPKFQEMVESQLLRCHMRLAMLHEKNGKLKEAIAELEEIEPSWFPKLRDGQLVNYLAVDAAIATNPASPESAALRWRRISRTRLMAMKIRNQVEREKSLKNIAAAEKELQFRYGLQLKDVGRAKGPAI